MMAMTPMPPTIRAIDEITTSARNVGLADLIPHLQHRVLRDQVEVVRLVEREPVADAHDRLDFAHRGLARDAVARHDGDHHRLMPPRTVRAPDALTLPNCLRYAV